MKFKKGDIINVRDTKKFNIQPWFPQYEVKEIANGDLFSDKYYVLSDEEGKRTFHDYKYVDDVFKLSLQHVLKNL